MLDRSPVLVAWVSRADEEVWLIQNLDKRIHFLDLSNQIWLDDEWDQDLHFIWHGLIGRLSVKNSYESSVPMWQSWSISRTTKLCFVDYP